MCPFMKITIKCFITPPYYADIQNFLTKDRVSDLSCLSSDERVAARPRLAPSDRWRSRSSPVNMLTSVCTYTEHQ